ncbi:chemotaxis protein CheD [Lederbergia graminis]|uniref:Probable chemoreceptor glutamine deamidase CheD n=1 Tax=Lederbergia graminis TaxID=735518 RepID=A0ABW0LFG2_9BACI
MINLVEKVSIADMKIVHAPTKVRTSGLGSCVGVVLYDDVLKVAGLAHVMLPDSSLARNKQFHPAKFADTAITALLDGLLLAGASQNRIQAKIAGGSQMFQFTPTSNQMRIGPRNVEAIKEMLQTLKIKLVAEDTGGHSGRTIEFDPETNMLLIKTVNQETKEI